MADSNPEQRGGGGGQDNTAPPGKTAGQRDVQGRRLGIHLARKSGVRGGGRAPGTVCLHHARQAGLPPLPLTTHVTASHRHAQELMHHCNHRITTHF